MENFNPEDILKKEWLKKESLNINSISTYIRQYESLMSNMVRAMKEYEEILEMLEYIDAPINPLSDDIKNKLAYIIQINSK